MEIYRQQLEDCSQKDRFSKTCSLLDMDSSLFYCESVSVSPVSGAGSFLLLILDKIIE